ncbi:ubiquitin-binding TORC1 subunit KOG1 [Ascoidea rubescens DSM 1968]|uniref:WD40 repeat-like protein n=1 Tax=Ascoidea rubescens DSM 1968 TaxID=1344418 RepID=A0A1D2VFF1_9ASCO|nr:WD40 repeat-like protein [Ascoidea rubescens DSM 1968]ODV60408.1 WD40 repeat-like protein [Ascoidea rubescens DSM 1968]
MVLRHGFTTSDIQKSFKNFFFYFESKTYLDNSNPIAPEEKKIRSNYYKILPENVWRFHESKTSTPVGGVLTCLKIGVVPPPPFEKINPSSTLEGWIDPSTFSDPKDATIFICRQITDLFNRFNRRSTMLRSHEDPNVDDIKKNIQVWKLLPLFFRLFLYYNGHGVPYPDEVGDFWLFNKQYNQYVPMSVAELQNWIGCPAIFVFDSTFSGRAISSYKRAAQNELDNPSPSKESDPIFDYYKSMMYTESFLFAACKEDEYLPSHPDLPADLFTCCLNSPIEMSIRFFILKSPLRKYYESLYDYIKVDESSDNPDQHRNYKIDFGYHGEYNQRDDSLGTLYQIFVALIDMLAASTVLKSLYRRCFRQDLMCNAMFRNFLLAQRIMKYYNVNPISEPPLPDLHIHPVWDQWDLIIEQFLSKTCSIREKYSLNTYQVISLQPKFVFTDFFETQLEALEYWIDYESFNRKPVPQFYLLVHLIPTPSYRLISLFLIAKMVDLGPWAVSLVLESILLPCIMKSLKFFSNEFKPLLSFIWAKIMASYHHVVQIDLMSNCSANYEAFIEMIIPEFSLKPELTRQQNSFYIRTYAPDTGLTDNQICLPVFVLTLFMRQNTIAQECVCQIHLIEKIVWFLENSNSQSLKVWCGLFLSQIWSMLFSIKFLVFKMEIIPKIIEIFKKTTIPEVRASIVYGFATYILLDDDLGDNVPNDAQIAELKQADVIIAKLLLEAMYDGSSMVRKQMVVFLSKYVYKYLDFFVFTAYTSMHEEVVLTERIKEVNDFRKKFPNYGSIYSALWKFLLILAADPHYEIRNLSETVIQYVLTQLINNKAYRERFNEFRERLITKFSQSPVKKLRHVGSMNKNGHNHSFSQPQPSLKRTVSFRSQHHLSSNSIGEIELPPTLSSTITSNIIRKSLSIQNFFKHISGFQNDENNLNGHENEKSFGGLKKTYIPHLARFEAVDNMRTIPKLPLESKFLDFSIEYFHYPQLKKDKSTLRNFGYHVDDQQSKDWRRNRNMEIIEETQSQKEKALKSDWSNLKVTIDNQSVPRLIEFSQFENWIVTADDKNIVKLWDWNKNEDLSNFSNNNPIGSKITDIKFLNEDDKSILLVGSSDGVIKIYRDFELADSAKLVTAWRALNDSQERQYSVGLITDWQQSTGNLLVSGDVRHVKIWDVQKEMCINSIPVRSIKNVTSLTSDHVAGNIIAAGFENGDIKIYDKRMESKTSMVKEWKGYSSNVEKKRNWIQKIHFQRGGNRELASGSTNGIVQLWDIRSDQPVVEFKAFSLEERVKKETDDGMSAFAIHEHAPIMATGSANVDLWGIQGALLQTIKIPNKKFFSSNMFINNMIFHPHRLMLAVKAKNEKLIHIYESSK